MEVDRPVRHFCYPYGIPRDVGERELTAVRECGYTLATTGTKGNLFAEHKEHLQALPRYSLGCLCDDAYLGAIANGTLPMLVNRGRRFATL